MSTFLIGGSYECEFAKVSRVDVEELSSAAEEGSDECDNDHRACVLLPPSRLRAHQCRHNGADRFRNVAAVVVPVSTQSRIRLNAYHACARMRSDRF